MTASDVGRELMAIATPAKAKSSSWFFKSGPGQYGEGDKFLGVTVPEQRVIAKKFKTLPINEVEKLITSPWHEERLVAIFILVSQFQKGDEPAKKQIYDFYLAHTKWVNNWDLVDSSAQYIVGAWLENKPEKLQTLEKLARSDLLWEKRIAIIATQHYLRSGSAAETLVIAQILLNDQHDLIQKAVGWMLREIGKYVDQASLLKFLDQYAATMPRTALRYAIEHLSPDQRQHYLKLKT